MTKNTAAVHNKDQMVRATLDMNRLVVIVSVADFQIDEELSLQALRMLRCGGFVVWAGSPCVGGSDLVRSRHVVESEW